MIAPAIKAKKVKWLERFFNLVLSVVSLSVFSGSAIMPLVDFYPTATTIALAYPF